MLPNMLIPKGISFIAIGSNDVVNYPEDSPEKMTEYAQRLKYPFPYLYDETQEVAKAYDAACTPDFYIFDNDLNTFWHTQWSTNPDWSWPHWVSIDMGATYNVNALTYIARQDVENGGIASYNLYISDSCDRSQWGAPVVTNGTFTNSSDPQQVTFTEKTGRYIIIEASSEFRPIQRVTTIAEIFAYGLPLPP